VVSFSLMVRLILIALLLGFKDSLTPPPPPKRRPIEVGKSLARVRMRRLGVEGDWRDYRTPGLTGWA